MATDIKARVNTRRMTPDDLVSGLALSREYKWPHRREDWEMLFQLGFGYVAETEGEVVGTAMTWLYGADAATLGNVIVAQKCHGWGIAHRLMELVLGDLDGRTVILHATDEGMGLSRRLGFEPVEVVHQHQGAAFTVPIAELMPEERVRPLGTKDMPMLRALARASSGMNRDALLDAVMTGARAVVLTRDHEPVGFSLLRRFGRGHVIGPTVAPDIGGAKALISHWLGYKSTMFCRLDVPETCGLSDWLDGLGLPRVNHVTRMMRGKPIASDPSVTTFSLTTQALG